MRCANHHQVEAVGHCTVCVKPLCRECFVVVEGKGYCKQHAERILVREERVEELKQRGIAIDTGSILAVLDGLAGLVVGFLLIILGFLAPVAQNSSIVSTTVEPFLQYFANVMAFPPGEALTIGFVLLSLGTVDMVAGYYLWRRSKVAAVASVAVTSVAGGLLAGYLIILALAGAFVFVYIVSAVIKIGAIGYGWRHLGSGTRQIQAQRVAPRPIARKVD
jgi:hypothetical protein